MSSELGPLYHWSPRSRLESIKRLGLVPGKPAVTGSDFRQDSICTSPDAATAWAYSHAVFKIPGTYDLWQFWLEDGDEVHVLPMWGGRFHEVRVKNRIKKSRLRWVGERTTSSSSP